jgi:hypothetical protein
MAASVQKVQSIVVATAVHPLSNAIALAVSHDVDMMFFNKTGARLLAAGRPGWDRRPRS